MGMNELLKKYKIISNDPYIPLQPDESAPESLLGGLRPRRHSAEESVVQIPPWIGKKFAQKANIILPAEGESVVALLIPSSL